MQKNIVCKPYESLESALKSASFDAVDANLMSVGDFDFTTPA